MSDRERIFQELNQIHRVVDRLECILNSLEEKTNMAMKIFKMVQELDLLPGFNVNIPKGFRKKANK